MLRGEGQGPAVLCKLGKRLGVKIDEVLGLQQVEIRPAWKNAIGVSAESMVIAGLAGREFAVSNSRKGIRHPCTALFYRGAVGWCNRRETVETKPEVLLIFVQTRTLVVIL